MATAKKKTTRKSSKATATADALPDKEPVPEGFAQIGGSYAPTWKPGEEGPKTLHGPVTGAVREVEQTIGRRKQTRRCMEVTQKKTGKAFTVWESATLGALFDHIGETGEGPEVWIRYDGVGKPKKGQHPPKLFTVAIKE